MAEQESPLKKIAREQAEKEKAKFEALQAKRAEEKKKDEMVQKIKDNLVEAAKNRDQVVLSTSVIEEAYKKTVGEQLSLFPAPKPAATDRIELEYSEQYTTSKSDPAAMLRVISDGMYKAKAKLLEKVAAKNMVSVGDVRWDSVEIDEDDNLYIVCSVPAHPAQAKVAFNTNPITLMAGDTITYSTGAVKITLT